MKEQRQSVSEHTGPQAKVRSAFSSAGNALRVVSARVFGWVHRLHFSERTLMYLLAFEALAAVTVIVYLAHAKPWEELAAEPYFRPEPISTLVTNGSPNVVGSGTANLVGAHDTPEVRANVTRCASLLSGAGVANGDELSFLDEIGSLEESMGWKKAYSLVGDEPAQRIGGGVEAVASAVYAAALGAGLKPQERHPLKFVPGFVAPGLDAAVWDNGKGDRGDLVLLNDTGAYVEFVATAEDASVTVKALSYVRTLGETREVQARVVGGFARDAADVYDDPGAYGLEPGDPVQFYTVETRVTEREGGEVVSQEIVNQEIYQLLPAE